MLSVEEARARILTHARLTEPEQVPLTKAAGRVPVLWSVTAEVDVPPFANSSMDGFALRAADVPGELPLAGEVAAGATSLQPLKPVTAVRIMTGAPLPAGADAVIPVEAAEMVGEERVRLPATQPGAYVRLVAHDTRRGDQVELPQEALSSASIAVLASLGIGRVSVRRFPVVAILSTGDELVEPGEPLRAGQIHDANSLSLAAAVREAGAEPLVLPRVRDEPAAIEAALADGVTRSDVLVVSGGVSVGRYDHVRSAIERLGKLAFWRIAVQPGKPLAFGSIGERPIVGLPGNPVSALVTFELFVRPFIRSMLGLVGDGRLHVRATPEARIEKDPARRAFLRVSVWHEDGEIHARAAGGQGSSQLRPLADANGLLVVPEGEAAAEPTMSYEAIMFEPLLLHSYR